MTSNLRIPTLEECEVALNEPARDWKGRCYEIACAIVKAGLVDGVAVYGHFLGEVAEGSFFGKHGGANMPFVQHGWVLLPNGDVFDPTRFAFDGKDPYLYVGDAEDYDEGGNQWRALNLRPFPEAKEGEQVFNVFEGLTTLAAVRLLDLMRGFYAENDENPVVPPMTGFQLLWVANVPYDALGIAVHEVYEALVKAGKKAFIPIDNYRRHRRLYDTAVRVGQFLCKEHV